VYVNVDDGVAPTFDQLQESFALREIGSFGNRSNETWVDYIVRRKDSKVTIGRVEATGIEHRAEVAYILDFDHWDKGYGSESLVWSQPIATDELWGESVVGYGDTWKRDFQKPSP
jgi:hypothetical protein